MDRILLVCHLRYTHLCFHYISAVILHFQIDSPGLCTFILDRSLGYPLSLLFATDFWTMPYAFRKNAAFRFVTNHYSYQTVHLHKSFIFEKVLSPFHHQIRIWDIKSFSIIAFIFTVLHARRVPSNVPSPHLRPRRLEASFIKPVSVWWSNANRWLFVVFRRSFDY